MHYAGNSYNGTSNNGGFGKRINDLVNISERVQRLIREKDSDGVVSYSYHDERTAANNVQDKLTRLETYARNVDRYVKDKIDQPFYEAMDKIGERLEVLSITKYSTSNTIGYKRTETITDEYGNSTTYEVTPKTITIEDFYKVDSPYKASLKSSYMVFKNSKEYQENKLSEEQYIMAMHHTRAFNYESLNEQRQAKEFWRDIALGIGVAILTIFCPPAGAVAGITLAGAEMYSVATGKDWGTGRELDPTERGMRAAFAVIDLIPGVKYMHSLSKAGKLGGATAIRTTIKQSITEGFEQGLKNIDNFKAIPKTVKQYGDNVLKRLDMWAHNKLISSAERLSDTLKGMDNALSSSARNFTLNMGLEPQLASGARVAGGQFDNITSKLDNFVQAGRNHIDELAENIQKFSLNNVDFVKPKHWLDDVDDIIRDGSHMDGNILKPNVVYETGEYRYLYKTDELGRIEKAYADDLQLKLHDGRLKHNPNTLGKLDGDHSGHIFGDLFGGSP